jgi:hypothetical protein
MSWPVGIDSKGIRRFAEDGLRHLVDNTGLDGIFYPTALDMNRTLDLGALGEFKHTEQVEATRACASHLSSAIEPDQATLDRAA